MGTGGPTAATAMGLGAPGLTKPRVAVQLRPLTKGEDGIDRLLPRTIGSTMTSDRPHTALILIDPYNDFISEGGKVWDQLKGVAEANDCVPHMLQVLQAARSSGLRVFYSLHRRYRAGDYETWKHVAPTQRVAWQGRVFA